MDQVLPFGFALTTLFVLVRIMFHAGCLERDRHIVNPDLLRPVA